MRAGSSFDGIHLFCEQRQLWTNLLDPRWAGSCLEDDEKAGAPVQMALPGLEGFV